MLAGSPNMYWSFELIRRICNVLSDVLFNILTYYYIIFGNANPFIRVLDKGLKLRLVSNKVTPS